MFHPENNQIDKHGNPTTDNVLRWSEATEQGITAVENTLDDAYFDDERPFSEDRATFDSAQRLARIQNFLANEASQPHPVEVEEVVDAFHEVSDVYQKVRPHILAQLVLETALESVHKVRERDHTSLIN